MEDLYEDQSLQISTYFSMNCFEHCFVFLSIKDFEYCINTNLYFSIGQLRFGTVCEDNKWSIYFCLQYSFFL